MMGKPNVEMQCGDAVVSIISEGEDIFIIADGMKIAKRGHPGTPQAKTCISLGPGWLVRDVGNGRGLNRAQTRAGSLTEHVCLLNGAVWCHLSKRKSLRSISHTCGSHRLA